MMQNISKIITSTDVLYTPDKGKTKEDISIGGVSDKTALNILIRYLLGEDYYIADPVEQTQANAIIIDDILKNYSSKYRKELRQEKNLENYANRLCSKLERKKNKMKRRKSK